MAKENKRNLILNALETLLPGKRFHEITLEEVAKAAQVGKGTIYLYFKDKDSLFAELVCYRLEILADELAMLENCGKDNLPEKVFELVGGFIRKHRSGFGAVGDITACISRMSGEQHERMQKKGNEVVNTLSEVMQKAYPEWNSSDAAFHAQVLLWLIDGYMRGESGNVSVLPDVEKLMNFYRYGINAQVKQ